MSDVMMTDIRDAACDVQRINLAISQAVGCAAEGRPVDMAELLVLVGAASELASDKAELIKASTGQAA